MEGTALVTGATGLLGSNLVAALRRRGVHVRAVARSLDKARAQLDPPGPDLTLVRGDMTDVGSLALAERVRPRVCSVITG